eukprot:Trichotokara_eunicae@DN2884_c0_g1_i2.p1
MTTTGDDFYYAAQFRDSGLTKAEFDEVLATFRLFDVKGEGKIEVQKVKDSLLHLLMQDQQYHVVPQMIASLEAKNQQFLNFGEYLQLVLPTHKGNDRETAARIFQYFDVDKKGSINARNLSAVSRRLGDEVSAFESNLMISRADTDGDGEVTLDDFYRVISKSVL